MRSAIINTIIAPLAAAALAGLAGSAAAGVYKCLGADGKQTIYQDSPCPAGRELRNFDQAIKEHALALWLAPSVRALRALGQDLKGFLLQASGRASVRSA